MKLETEIELLKRSKCKPILHFRNTNSYNTWISLLFQFAYVFGPVLAGLIFELNFYFKKCKFCKRIFDFR